MSVKDIIYVDSFVDGILDPEKDMLGPVKNGGLIIANTTPGCWGPMITPELKGAHEVTKPVYVDEAQIGDSIAIHIKSIEITSKASASGVHEYKANRYLGDPGVAAKCENCGTLRPASIVNGTGKQAIKCSNCGKEVSPYEIKNGYTMIFDHDSNLGLTVDKNQAEEIAKSGHELMAVPENSIQNPAVSLAPSDLVGVISEIRPFMGQIGTTPSIAMPDSRNAGDLGALLINAPHEFSLSVEELDNRTDGHMDINRAREGATVICPVKVEGGGVYLGDMHAMQGDGEIAGHTTDVSGIVTVQVEVIKGLTIDGPILLPLLEDLPHLAKPLNKNKLEKAYKLAEEWAVKEVEQSLPVSVIGTGIDLNQATDNALERSAKLLSCTKEEIMNRCTIMGSIEIGRHPGVVTATFKAPKKKLEELGLLKYINNKYHL